MAGVPYQTSSMAQSRKGFSRAPKGKLPYIDDEGEIIADSSLIRMHLEVKYHVDFEKGLDATQKAIGWAAEKMMEEHLYFAAVDARWLVDENFAKLNDRFFKGVPGLLRPVVTGMVRRQIAKSIKAQGLGRHSREDMVRLVIRDIETIAVLLGDKPYIFGDKPCGFDASIGAFTMGVLCKAFNSPLRDAAESHSNLVAYVHRLKGQSFPELAS